MNDGPAEQHCDQEIIIGYDICFWEV